ncbi:MAG TPA: hypothetical protein VER38_03130 [Candidatus Eisenbacteria bacterium]|nr:hypothetical protein [Candidatus Eisenbacteria bacterium]
MADVMEERIHSIERTAGFAFVIASVILSTTMIVHPVFRDVNNTGLVLRGITSSRGEAWMQVHAIMAAGFAIATIAFCALAFLLHMKGSSGSASVVWTCALLGGGIWVTFLCAELYAARFFTNLYSVDAGGATMLFSTIWFWKIGALVAGALLFFGAVFFAGVTAVKRDLIPLWLGWGGALVALVGALIYVMDFWASTATGAASQPMQWPAMRYGVGLPLELWMLGVGVIFLQRYFTRPVPMRMTHPRPSGEHAARRNAEQAAHQPAGSGAGSGARQPAAPDPSRPAPPRIPHPALAPDPEPEQLQRPAPGSGRAPAASPEGPKRPPPQIFPG